MKAKKSLLVVLICAGIFNVYAQLPSFPGALGFGASATGGRGGKVIYVTNTNISGPGSLQEALNESGKKIHSFQSKWGNQWNG